MQETKSVTGGDRTLSINDRADAAKWVDAAPVWSDGYGNTLRIVYACRIEGGGYLAYSVDRGYVGPFTGMAKAVRATRPVRLQEIEAPATVKFLKKGVKAGGKYYPCWYSLCQLINGKTAITLYAKSILIGLPSELHPQNDSDMSTDYFEKDKVRFYAGSFTFEQLKHFCS